MSTVEFADVTKAYGEVFAVKDVSIALRAGELTTIVGPSGSGKSTILGLIAGIIAPTAGRILVGGRDITWVSPAERNVGLVFQSYALFPHLTVFENVAFPLRVRRIRKVNISDQVMAALARVGLEDLIHRRPSELSGGQQQRVALARAIVFQPDILLLDEPLAALDRKLRESVRLEIRHLQKSLGITTILVTHDQEEALSMADQVITLDGGEVQQVDTPENIYRRPANRFVAEFLGIANMLEGEIKGAGDDTHILLTGGERITCRSHQYRGSRVCGMLRPEQISLESNPDKGKIQAVVDEVIFLGEAARYLLTSKGGHHFVVQLSGQRQAFNVGSIVSLDWEPVDIWILSSDTELHTASTAPAIS
jgi:putative spermidine/putrescine transport system ATP-binding protein